MGYTTEIYGGLRFSRELTAAEVETINRFNDEDHRAEDVGFPGIWCQWIVVQPRQDVVGTEGVLSREGENYQVLSWDGNEKFYDYVEWLRYLIARFFDLWGVKLDGELTWQGEERADVGKIVVESSEVRVLRGKVSVDFEEANS